MSATIQMKSVFFCCKIYASCFYTHGCVISFSKMSVRECADLLKVIYIGLSGIKKRAKSTAELASCVHCIYLLCCVVLLWMLSDSAAQQQCYFLIVVYLVIVRSRGWHRGQVSPANDFFYFFFIKFSRTYVMKKKRKRTEERKKKSDFRSGEKKYIITPTPSLN